MRGDRAVVWSCRGLLLRPGTGHQRGRCAAGKPMCVLRHCCSPGHGGKTPARMCVVAAVARQRI